MNFHKNISSLMKKNKKITADSEQSHCTDCSSEEYLKSKEIIANMPNLRFLEIGGIPSDQKPKFAGEYTGGFVEKDKDGGIITFCVFMKDGEKNLKYKHGSNIALVYPKDGELFLGTAKIISAENVSKENLEKFSKLFEDRIQNLIEVLGPLKFIVVNALMLTVPAPHQRRQYDRIEVNWNIYFRIINPDKETSAARQKWIDDKIFPSEKGYFIIQTTDISAGGYRSIIKVPIRKDTRLDNVIEINTGKIKAAGKVEGRVVNCTPNYSHEGCYDLRVQFLDMNDSIISKAAQSMVTAKKIADKK
jgi:hypothetical protein